MPFPTVHSSGLAYGGLPDTTAQEHLSHQYVRAVATAARCHAQVYAEADFEGIDAVIRSLQLNHERAFPSIAAQLKCTQRSDLVHADCISWTLKRANYDQLRVQPIDVPRILIVMVCPPDFTTWLHQDDERLTLSHAAYWVSLRGQPELKAGQDSKTVRVPLSQPFTVEALLGMMAKTGRGELL